MPKISKKEKKVHYAFFDLDGTLLEWDTMFLFCNYILKKERWRTFYLLVFVPAVILRIFKVIDTVLLKRIFYSFLFRMHRPALRYYVEDFVENTLMPLFFVEMRDRIQEHLTRGDTLVLNTASISLYAECIAKKLGFHLCYSTLVREQNPLPFLLSMNTNNIGKQKLESMFDILSQQKGRKKLKNSYVYTDSIIDLPLTSIAEKVTIVHPSQEKLKSLAEKKKWEILYPKEIYFHGTSFFKKLRYANFIFQKILGL